MHGVVGEALGEGLHRDITSRMEGFCRSDVMASHKRGNCAHAIGHALLLNSRDLARIRHRYASWSRNEPDLVKSSALMIISSCRHGLRAPIAA